MERTVGTGGRAPRMEADGDVVIGAGARRRQDGYHRDAKGSVLKLQTPRTVAGARGVNATVTAATQSALEVEHSFRTSVSVPCRLREGGGHCTVPGCGCPRSLPK